MGSGSGNSTGGEANNTPNIHQPFVPRFGTYSISILESLCREAQSYRPQQEEEAVAAAASTTVHGNVEVVDYSATLNVLINHGVQAQMKDIIHAAIQVPDVSFFHRILT